MTLIDDRPVFPKCPDCGGAIKTYLATGVIFYETPGSQRNRTPVLCEQGHRFVIEDAPSGRWHVYETK